MMPIARKTDEVFPRKPVLGQRPGGHGAEQEREENRAAGDGDGS